MAFFRGFMSVVLMLCVSYILIGYFILLPYWLVITVIGAESTIGALLICLGLAVWLIVSSTLVVGIGNSEKGR